MENFRAQPMAWSSFVVENPASPISFIISIERLLFSRHRQTQFQKSRGKTAWPKMQAPLLREKQQPTEKEKSARYQKSQTASRQDKILRRAARSGPQTDHCPFQTEGFLQDWVSSAPDSG